MRSGRSRFIRLVLPVCLALALLAPTGSGEPLPTPTFPPISFTTTGNSALREYMEIELGQPVEAAMAAFGEPTAVYGQDGYVYRAIAGAGNAEPAVVYRFRANSLNFECIASALDGRILKKQVSSPGAFSRLLANASALAVEGGTPYPDLLLTAGVDPYLWMSFLPPNAETGADRYEVCLWPDASGQLVAVVQGGVVLRCEYQPNGMVLPAAEVDGLTPRAPRYLKALPENGNSALSDFTPFMKFATLRPGQGEADVTRVMGVPTYEASGGGLRTLSYEYPHGGYATGGVAFSFTVADDDSRMLIAKNVEAFPLGDAEVRARYAPQMLPGMAMDDILGFMGEPLATNQSLSTAGGVFTAYSYTGRFACVSAVFESGGDYCLWHEAIVNDAEEEAATLYEEYVLLGEGEPGEGEPGEDEPTPTPTPMLPDQYTVRPTRTPKPPSPTPGPTRTHTPNRTPSPTPSHEVTPPPPTPTATFRFRTYHVIPLPTATPRFQFRTYHVIPLATPTPTGPY